MTTPYITASYNIKKFRKVCVENARRLVFWEEHRRCIIRSLDGLYSLCLFCCLFSNYFGITFHELFWFSASIFLKVPSIRCLCLMKRFSHHDEMHTGPCIRFKSVVRRPWHFYYPLNVKYKIQNSNIKKESAQTVCVCEAVSKRVTKFLREITLF